MNIIVNKDRLCKVLGFLERIVSRNTTLPILNNVLLQVENGRLKVLATNLEIGVSSLIGAKVSVDGKIAVPGRALSDFIRNAPGDTVTLELKQNTLTISAGSYKTTILCFDASEYPIIPKIENGQKFTIASKTFKNLISSVVDSISTSDSRPELTGALLKFEDGFISMAATDIFRLAEKKVKSTHTGTGSVIIPRNALLELGKILSDVDGEVVIHISDNQASFSHDEFEMVSRIIDGKYPDYRKIIPDRAVARVLVRREELENAAKVAALFSSSISDIKLECDTHGLNISGKNANKGEARAGVEANLQGEPFEVSMNYHYFLDGLKVIQSEKIVLEFTGKGSPFVLRPNTEDKDVVYLIMPLRS